MPIGPQRWKIGVVQSQPQGGQAQGKAKNSSAYPQGPEYTPHIARPIIGSFFRFLFFFPPCVLFFFLFSSNPLAAFSFYAIEINIIRAFLIV